MKQNEFDETRYNFYYAMEKIREFYEGYLEWEGPTEDDLDDYGSDMYADADKLALDIKNLFDEPINTIGDLIYKGKEIMELKERIELFEYWYC